MCVLLSTLALPSAGHCTTSPLAMAFPMKTSMKKGPAAKHATKSAMKKVMKAKRVSKIAKGRLAKALVMTGRKVKTAGGLTRDMLMRNKRGKIVSKRGAANGKRAYKRVEHWTEAFMGARKALQINGFVAINGKTLQGKALYVKTKSLAQALQRGQGSPSRPALGSVPPPVMPSPRGPAPEATSLSPGLSTA